MTPPPRGSWGGRWAQFAGLPARGSRSGGRQRGTPESLEALIRDAAAVLPGVSGGAGWAAVVRPAAPAAAALAIAVTLSSGLGALPWGPVEDHADARQNIEEGDGIGVRFPPPDALRDSRPDFCPDVSDLLGFGNRARARAARTATSFDAALVRDDRAEIAAHIDPAPGALNLKPRAWDHTRLARGLVVTYSAPATDDDAARILCDAEVAARSWKVVMHDASGVSAAGVATFYLVRRAEGWKVWGSY